MKKAFQPGYEPALLEGKRENHQRGLRTRRLEQRQQIDNIISGKESGQYWTLLGPKVSDLYQTSIPYRLSLNFECCARDQANQR